METAPDHTGSLRMLSPHKKRKHWQFGTVTADEPAFVDTEDKESIENARVFKSSNTEARQGQLPFPQEDDKPRVRAVVTSIDENKASLECHLPHDTTNIELPIEFLPEPTARYGAPVWVSVDVAGGYKRIKIEERAELNKLDPPDDLKEIRAWLSSDV